ncbi:MAG: CPBP family intramembrane metalloprotease [Gemmatimonadetes bacterium]|nr:CPBP family intramembrane metalloprotease [Gemmatimonadota bacterium]
MSGLPWADTAALVALLVFLPVLSVAQVGMLRRVEVERMGAYVSSAVSLVALGGGAWLVGTRNGGPAALGLAPLGWASFAAWTTALVAAGLAVTAAFRAAGPRLGLRESTVLRALLPRSGRERAAFAALSLVAGSGEELAYRGYVIPVLAGVVGTPMAAAVSSAVFGVLHAYQGLLGMARTAVMGGVLAWGFLASGSLWPPIAAHAVLDLLLGMALAERMMVPEERHP